MSQAAAKRKIQIRNETVKVIARFREQGSALAGTKRGTTEGFTLELTMDSDASEGEIADMVQLAHRMCFTEAALSREVPLAYSHHLNGKPLQIEPPQDRPQRR